MLSIRGAKVRCCDGFTRRDFLRIGGLGTMGLMLPSLLKAQAASAAAHSFGSAKRCIMLFMYGGPPHQDTWDLKPDAPAEIRGEFKPIKTNVPGIEISEYFPMLARHADKYAIIRSVTQETNIHTIAAHAMLTGHPYPKPAQNDVSASPDDFPHYGAVLSQVRPSDPRLPTFVALPLRIGNTDGKVTPGQGGGFIGGEYDPFQVNVTMPRLNPDPQAYENLNFRTPNLTLSEGISSARMNARRGLQREVDTALRAIDREATMRSFDYYAEKAFNILSSRETQRAFNLDAESAKVRDRYGRLVFGQGCLLARRLIEAGVSLVTVYWHMDGTAVDPAWDTHKDNYPNLKNRLMPPTDRAFSALLEELNQRGLLEDTLVVWSGEFGRTPKINAQGGRDHWGTCQSVVMAGAGVKGGQVFGSSDETAGYPVSDAVTPADVGATIYHLLGISPNTEVIDQTGRPHPIIRGTPIHGVME
jgi:hypothetical protein